MRTFGSNNCDTISQIRGRSLSGKFPMIPFLSMGYADVLGVKDIARTSITKTPSKLFSGINLQMHLSKTVGIPPEDSLKAIQRLYEDGYISYPRTSTEYITMAEKPNIEKIIAMYVKWQMTFEKR